MKFFIIFLLLIFLVPQHKVRAQSLADDANLSNPISDSENVFNETIKVISSSKKIFVLTNNSGQLGTGDFVSLALDNKLAARAIVAKVHQGQVGIKIVKIYSVNQWGKLHRDKEVQVIKGDDSMFGKKPEEKKSEDTAKIKSEEDLYSGDLVETDELGALDENKNRHIKPDNIVALYGGFFQAQKVDSEGGTVRSTEFGLSWAYQFTDNFFAEGIYGRAMLDSYPADGIQTLVNHVIARVKYNIKGPLYTFFMPYVGYHNYFVQSPQAGKSGNQSQDADELDAINKLKKSGPVAGVTILRRLVPGWFVKADLGLDIINVGFAIEF